MGCGCGKNASRPTSTNNSPARIPGAVRSAPVSPPPRTQTANVTPRPNVSASGLSVYRKAVEDAKQEAIRRSLGGQR